MSETVSTLDGLGLAAFRWPPQGGGLLRGRVLIVHGLGEHAQRHAELAVMLAGLGWEVLAYDQRGHGRSPGPRGGMPTDQALLQDLGQAVRWARPAAGPLVLLGHSMGGAVAARYVAEGLAPSPSPWFHPVDALVLSSPALAAELSPWQRLLLFLGRLAPDQAAGNGLDPAWISRDPEVVRAYRSDPLVHDRITPRLARFILEAGSEVRARAPRWCVPTLLLWAGADRCVAPSGSASFARSAPPGVVSAHPFDGLAHEIFHEPERARVYEALRGWLAVDSEGTPSATASFRRGPA